MVTDWLISTQQGKIPYSNIATFPMIYVEDIHISKIGEFEKQTLTIKYPCFYSIKNS